MTSAADLLTLQDIDLKIDSRRALIADIDSRLGETDEVIQARTALTDAEAEAGRVRREQRALDAQLEDLDAKMRPIETRLYDGSVRNPRELSDLQKELEGMKKRRGQLDDQGLQMMEVVEAANTALETARQALQAAEASWREDQHDLVQDRERAERETGALGAERQRWASSMDAPSLGLYEGLRSQKNGRGVARIERSTCQGCRLSLPTHVVQRVRTGMQLVQCPSCERILVGA